MDLCLLHGSHSTGDGIGHGATWFQGVAHWRPFQWAEAELDLHLGGSPAQRAGRGGRLSTKALFMQPLVQCTLILAVAQQLPSHVAWN